MVKPKSSAGNLPSVEKAKHQLTPDVAEPNVTDTACKPSAKPLSPGLYLVATPIGNAGDITLRALDILARADVVLCEDTRISGKLLHIHSVRASLHQYHEHNAERVRPMIMKRLKDGEIVALISDAGMPLVSDPGYKLVEECLSNGFPITAAPGPSSSLTALVLSGLPTDRFFFQGFLPSKTGARRRALEDISTIPSTLIFLESAKRLAGCLADMVEVLGPREAAVGRELTKYYEEVRRADLGELAAHYAKSGPPKGEITLCVGPPLAKPAPTEDELTELLSEALKTDSVKVVAAEFARQTGLPKRDLYARALAIKDA